MVERVEITDEQSARAWLETQDHQTQVWFAARCALRVFPLLGMAPDLIKRRNELAYLRALSISASFGTSLKPPDHFRIMSTSAFLHLTNARDATGYGYGEEVALVRSAARATIKSLADHDRALADSARPYAWSKIACQKLDDEEILLGDLLTKSDRGEIAANEDVHANHRWTPLWGTIGWPTSFEDSWEAIKAQWDDDVADWSFWIEWYESILSGTPLPWELTQRIALEVTNEEWEAGPGEVARRIAAIRDDFEAKRSAKSDVSAPEPTEAQKASVAERVTQNRDAITFAVAGLLGQLSEYRERIRGLNGLEPEFREELLSFIDNLSGNLNKLLSLLPEQPEEIKAEEGGKFINWLREYKSLVPGVAKRYAEPQNAAEASVPVAIILGCTSVGTLVGGPVGATAGAVVGGLITNQMKPGQAAKAILDSPWSRPDA